MAGGAGVVMMCSYCAAASAWRWLRSLHSLSVTPAPLGVGLQEIGRAGDAHGGIPPRRVDRRQRGGNVERRELLRGQRQVGGREVVGELVDAAGADDGRRDPRL